MSEKKYNVYGIGNAVVDLEFEVTDEFLEKHDVQKGVMTLVDEETQFRLINDISKKSVIQKSGGSAANTIMAITQFGGKGYYSCKVSNDPYGTFFLKEINDAGIDTNFNHQETGDGITGKCLVMITKDANRTLNTFLGITSELSVDEVDEGAIKNSEYVFLEGYLVASDTAFDAMKRTKKVAEKANVKTVLTLSDPTIVDIFKKRFQDVIGASVDLLICNEQEAKNYVGKDDLMEVREEMKKDAKKFVITQGENGAMIFDGETFIDIEPYPVKAVDTNGAGDMFAGAFLYGITHEMGYAGAGKLASLAGSKIVAQYGPRLKTDEIQKILEDFS